MTNLGREFETKLEFPDLFFYVKICRGLRPEYMGINGSDLKFVIRRTSSRTQTPVAGSYDEKNKVVTLEISTYSTTNHLISTLSHELSHHILLSNGFELKERKMNEIFSLFFLS